MHASGAADAGASVLMQNLDALHFAHKQRKTHVSVHKTVFVNISEDFNREDDLQFFAQPYLFELEYTY